MKQLTNLPLDINSFKWGNDSNKNFLIIAIDVYVDCDTLECTAQRNNETQEKGPNTGFIYDSLFVRHWDTWETGKHSHLWRLNLNWDGHSWNVENDPIDLMKGMSANSPTSPFGGPEQYDISPDGMELAFTAEMIDHSTAWTTGWRIYLVPTNGKSNPKWLTSYTAARTQNPAYSPNGNMLAFLAMDRPGFEADRLHVALYSRKSQSFSQLTSNWDRSVAGISWSPDSKMIFCDADDDGRHKLFIVSVSNSAVTEVISDGNNVNVLFGLSNTAYLLRDFMVAPADVWSFRFQDTSISGLTQVTFENQDLLNQIWMSQPETFYFTGSDNAKIQSWLLKPYNFTETTKWPVVLLIHGGPQGAWLDDWSYRWNPQLWASHGYAVIAINPHGSTGFGQKFTDAVSKNWGGKPFIDLMNGTDAALQRYSWMKPQSVFACGASYGGYMINWINSQTNRFKALVCHDGAFDTMGLYYSTDELWFNEWEFGGVPWQNPKLYDVFNPLRYSSQMKTPTLIIHGGRDYRLPISQGISTFTALQRRGIPSKLLYFPEENHWVLNPSNGILWYNTVLAWLDQWNSNQ